MITNNTAIIAFGSNIENRLNYIIKALKLIELKIGHIKLISNIYETYPLGHNLNNLFLNGVLIANTTLSPEHVLNQMLDIEKILGRKRSSLNLDRTIDLDLLFYINSKNENLIINTSKLIIPHPQLLNRDFVMIPLVELAPSLINPITHNTIQLDLNKNYDKLCHKIIKTYLKSDLILKLIK